MKIADGQYKTMSSGIKASKPGIKWTEEMKSRKVEAERIIGNRRAEKGIEIQDRSERTFSEVCAMYRDNFSTDTYLMQRMETEFGDRLIDEISPLDIRRYHNKLLERCKPTTWNRHRNVLNAIFNRAIEWGICTSNPVKTVKRYPDQKVKRFLNGEHATALLAEAQKKDFYLYAFVHFALKTGRRESEILDLKWDDIDFGTESIRYRIRKKQGGCEVHYRRQPKSVFQILFLLQRINKETPFPFFPRSGWRSIRDKVDKEMGLPDRRFYALRHRCATEMIEKGATLYDVQYYLCHSTPTMTMIYAHVSDKRDEKIAAFLE